MPFFFYSGMDSDMKLCREAKQDKIDMAKAAQSQRLSQEEQKKLDAFVASIDELYHLFNLECGESPNPINETLHALSVGAIDKMRCKSQWSDSGAASQV